MRWFFFVSTGMEPDTTRKVKLNSTVKARVQLESSSSREQELTYLDEDSLGSENDRLGSRIKRNHHGGKHKCYVCMPKEHRRDVINIFPAHQLTSIRNCSGFDLNSNAHEYEFSCPDHYKGCILRIEGMFFLCLLHPPPFKIF